MTLEQAEAILEAERVLQEVGAGGPDNIEGSAWHGLVSEACKIADLAEFSDLHLKCYLTTETKPTLTTELQTPPSEIEIARIADLEEQLAIKTSYLDVRDMHGFKAFETLYKACRDFADILH